PHHRRRGGRGREVGRGRGGGRRGRGRDAPGRGRRARRRARIGGRGGGGVASTLPPRRERGRGRAGERGRSSPHPFSLSPVPPFSLSQTRNPMSQISAQDVKRLRETTGVGMMDCKRALEEAGGDFDAAIEILRKKGQKVAAKRADREATEGVVATATTPDRKAGALVEVNSETDFVARNEEFTTFAQRIADLVLAERPADMDALRALPLDGRTVGAAATAMTGKIGEAIDCRRFAIIEADGDGEVVDYVHPGAKLGVLVEMAGSGDLQAVGRDVAMQAAAMNPVAATRDEVPEEVKAKELEIGREAARN